MYSNIRYVGLIMILVCLAGCNTNSPPSPAENDQPPIITQSEDNAIAELSLPAKRLYWQVNELRAQNGIRPMELKTELCDLAKQQVAYMIEQGQLTHLSSSGLKIDGRLKAAGIHWTVCAENIGRVDTDKDLAKNIISKWQETRDDRENMLNELCLETGLAVTKDEQTGKWYVTQIFLRRTLFWEK